MQRLAVTLDAVKATRSRKEKVSLLAACLKTLDDRELPGAARVVLAQPLAVGDARTTGVGWALLLDALAAASTLTMDSMLRAMRQAGDLGEGLESLWPPGRPGLPLADVAPLFDALAAASTRADRLTRLSAAFALTTGPEMKYLVKALLGELRIGLQRSTFDEAVALAFGVDPSALRSASALTPDGGALALLARSGQLASATLVVGRVVSFMLATPLEAVKEPLDPALTVVEDKLDGVRVQAHVRDGSVTLFARGTGDVTQAFPEVVARLASVSREVVLDGEVIAVADDGSPRPFQALQARLGRLAPTASELRDTRVEYLAFDCLHDGGSLLERTWQERRARLETLGLAVNPVFRLDVDRPVEEQLEALFQAARARGHEGLMLKRLDAPYEAGRRGSAWRKVKRAYATLDVVITRAERGHGRRAKVLSDYTFAVWRGAGLVDIGKAYSGLTDVEIAALTEQLQALAIGSDGRALVVKPEIVLEVAFDGLQPSRRHDSGFALRFPRIVRLRPDKRAADADRLETVKALFDAQVSSGHRERAPQLDLFE